MVTIYEGSRYIAGRGTVQQFRVPYIDERGIDCEAYFDRRDEAVEFAGTLDNADDGEDEHGSERSQGGHDTRTVMRFLRGEDVSEERAEAVRNLVGMQTRVG